MANTRSVRITKRQVVALVAVIAGGVIVGQLVSWWAGLGTAIAILAVNEVIERRARR